MIKSTGSHFGNYIEMYGVGEKLPRSTECFCEYEDRGTLFGIG